MRVYINSTWGPFSETDAFSNCSQKKRGKQIFKGIFLHISLHSKRGLSTQRYGIWNNDIAEVWLITHRAIRACCWIVQERIDPRALCFHLPIMKFSFLSLHTNGCLIYLYLFFLSITEKVITPHLLSSLACIYSPIISNYFSKSAIRREYTLYNMCCKGETSAWETSAWNFLCRRENSPCISAKGLCVSVFV